MCSRWLFLLERSKTTTYKNTLSEDKSKTKEKKKETSYQNPSYDPKQFYNSDDDAQICTIVPIKERKVIFEQLQTENSGNEEGEKKRGGK